MATFGEWFVKLLAELVLRQKWNADNMSHGQGKPQNGQGNVREKSGNFVRAHGWTPCVGQDLLVNIGSGDGLLPDGTKPWPQLILAYHQ